MNFFGSGMTMPFLMLYLHVVRHFTLGFSGVVIGFSSFVGLVSIPLIGYAVDRWGSFRILVLSLTFLCVGTLGYAVAGNAWLALLSSLFTGFGNSAMWNALSSRLAVLAGKEQRANYFGISYAVTNLGLGFGALLAGILVHSMKPETFYLIFLIDASTYLLFIPLLFPTRTPTYEDEQGESLVASSQKPSGMREVLKDRALLAVTGLNLLFVVFGYSQLNSSFTVWATSMTKVNAGIVGLAFFANCMAIVLIQFPVLVLTKKWLRTRLAAVASGLFALCWLLTWLAGVDDPQVATILLVAALTMFGLGETFLSPSLTPIINDLAPEALRGRYNAMGNLSWQAGMIIGPLLAGFALGHGYGRLLFVFLTVILAGGVLLAFWMERIVPFSANR